MLGNYLLIKPTFMASFLDIHMSNAKKSSQTIKHKNKKKTHTHHIHTYKSGGDVRVKEILQGVNFFEMLPNCTSSTLVGNGDIWGCVAR